MTEQLRRALSLLKSAVTLIAAEIEELEAPPPPPQLRTNRTLMPPRDKTAIATAGGLARAAALSPERRREIGRKAAQVRWNKESPP